MPISLILTVLLILFVLTMLAKTVRVIPQGRAGIVERLGKFHAVLNPHLPRSDQRGAERRTRLHHRPLGPARLPRGHQGNSAPGIHPGLHGEADARRT